MCLQKCLSVYPDEATSSALLHCVYTSTHAEYYISVLLTGMRCTVRNFNLPEHTVPQQQQK